MEKLKSIRLANKIIISLMVVSILITVGIWKINLLKNKEPSKVIVIDRVSDSTKIPIKGDKIINENKKPSIETITVEYADCKDVISIINLFLNFNVNLAKEVENIAIKPHLKANIIIVSSYQKEKIEIIKKMINELDMFVFRQRERGFKINEVIDTIKYELSLRLSNLKMKTKKTTIAASLVNSKQEELYYNYIAYTQDISEKEIISEYKKPVIEIFDLKYTYYGEILKILDDYTQNFEDVNVNSNPESNSIIIAGSKEKVEEIVEIIAELDTKLISKSFTIDKIIEEIGIEELRKKLSIIIPEENRFTIDTNNNLIKIKGSREEINNVEFLVSNFHIFGLPLLIEAKVVEINVDAEEDLGMKWIFDKEGTSGQLRIGETSFWFLDRINNTSYETRLEALQNEGKAKILSNPKILAYELRDTKILRGSTVPVRTITSEGLDAIKFVNLGLSMSLWLRLKSNNLYLFVNLKLDSINKELVQGYPVFNSREERVTIRTKLGNTVVIGGLISSEDIKNYSPINISLNVPVISDFYKFIDKTNKNSEIIILVKVNGL
ncbi:Type 3 secretion system secretin [subsurface metagenome]|jgi:type II secretory pathway component GspD/PulD (secretin)